MAAVLVLGYPGSGATRQKIYILPQEICQAAIRIEANLFASMEVRSVLNNSRSAVRKSIRNIGVLLGIGMLIGAFGFIYTAGQAQQSDPHYGQLQTAQPANLNFQSLSACASEFYMLDAQGNRTALSGEAANVNFAQLRVAAVQLEFQSTGGCRVVLDLTAQS